MHRTLTKFVPHATCCIFTVPRFQRSSFPLITQNSHLGMNSFSTFVAGLFITRCVTKSARFFHDGSANWQNFMRLELFIRKIDAQARLRQRGAHLLERSIPILHPLPIRGYRERIENVLIRI